MTEVYHRYNLLITFYTPSLTNIIPLLRSPLYLLARPEIAYSLCSRSSNKSLIRKTSDLNDRNFLVRSIRIVTSFLCRINFFLFISLHCKHCCICQLVLLKKLDDDDDDDDFQLLMPLATPI